MKLSLSRCDDSMDFSNSLSPFVPIICHFRQIFLFPYRAL